MGHEVCQILCYVFKECLDTYVTGKLVGQYVDSANEFTLRLDTSVFLDMYFSNIVEISINSFWSLLGLQFVWRDVGTLPYNKLLFLLGW